MPWKVAGLVCCALIVIGTGRHTASTKIDISTPRLQIHEEPERVILDWAGPVEPPMHDLIATALDRYRTDPRRIVLALNSPPGGNVAHGRAVMASIKQMGRLRRIDTRLEAGAICASMCVPIYMQGARRSADPAARFMFHEAKLNPSMARLVNASASGDSVRKSFENAATSILYKTDLRGTGVSWQWLDRMRNDIVDREVWRTARQLKEEESGVVVELGAEGPR